MKIKYETQPMKWLGEKEGRVKRGPGAGNELGYKRLGHSP